MCVCGVEFLLPRQACSQLYWRGSIIQCSPYLFEARIPINFHYSAITVYSLPLFIISPLQLLLLSSRAHRMASAPSVPLSQPSSKSMANNDHLMTDAPFRSQSGTEKSATPQDQENVSPSKARHSRVLSGNGLSPLKILTARESDTTSATKPTRNWLPDKRFPVKVNTTTAVSGEKAHVEERTMTLEDAVKENRDLAKAIQIFEDEDEMDTDEENHTNMTRIDLGEKEEHAEGVEDDTGCGADDTMLSTFSTFSAVPNLTMFAKIGHTPTKFAEMGSPITSRKQGASPSRTPRAPPPRDSLGNTTNLLDFTEQIESFQSRYAQQVASYRNNSPNKYKTVSCTPKKRHSNLMDFDLPPLPPLPTPRSIPSITPRELESLKSGFQAEISSLKATLSGKDAEVLSLKSAVGDAEKRVGECLEELREVKIVKETLIEERASWEKRGQDMETVLQKVKEEIVRNQHDREEMESKLEESEKRREAAEIMAQEAESKMAATRAGKANSDSGSDTHVKSPDGGKVVGSREVEIAVEKVSRELHGLYKSKHEVKIAALKKSYEGKWSEKVQKLEARLQLLTDENEQLRAGRDATMTKLDANQTIIDDERKEQAIKDSTQIKELTAEIDKLTAFVKSVQDDNKDLRQNLEQERVEKGELVLLAEEIMRLQDIKEAQRAEAAKQAANEAAKPAPAPVAATPEETPPAPKIQKTSAESSFRSSMGRGTGLRPPNSIKKPKTSTESRIGGPSTERKIGGGIPRPGSALGGRSGGIMSSIEKMGNHRGRGGGGESRGEGRGE
ncbi:hypothetical protein F5Y16DRAFT_356189 [Xylariaceae sp. FL0255]|nr:hypothetical protein F5Y16DRAFT_356189 [Xylariaceae sp. FL0255]